MVPHIPIKPLPSKVRGAAYVLISWIFFTLVIALSRFASAKTSVPTVLFFENLICLLLMLPIVIKRGAKSLYMSKIGVIVLRSLAGYINYAFVFFAVQRIPLVNVVLLSNAAPLFIPIIIWLWKRVTIQKSLWVGVIIGFIGVAVILKPHDLVMNIGSLFALGSAVCLSISMITQRRLIKTEPMHTILFYYYLISVIISLPFSFETWHLIDGEAMLFLMAIGICFFIGQIFFTRSLKYERPSFLSSFNYSSVIYGVLIEWLIWDHFPSWTTIIGTIIVCTGGIITITHGTRISSGEKEKDQSSR